MNKLPFYKKKLTYDEIAPFAQKFIELLRRNCSVVQEAGEGDQEVFFVDKTISEKFTEEYYKMYAPLSLAKIVTVTPYDQNHALVYFDHSKTGPIPTVSPSHVRLPKLSYLITLIPADFFILMKLVATAKNTQSKDSLSLNPAACGINSVELSPLAPFFLKLRTNYRLNPDYADRKWTPRSVISAIAQMEPTRDNQLSVMQYLTAMQNTDLIYFPIETMLELGLEWEQMNDDYCIPEGRRET